MTHRRTQRLNSAREISLATSAVAMATRHNNNMDIKQLSAMVCVARSKTKHDLHLF